MSTIQGSLVKMSKIGTAWQALSKFGQQSKSEDDIFAIEEPFVLIGSSEPSSVIREMDQQFSKDDLPSVRYTIAKCRDSSIGELYFVFPSPVHPSRGLNISSMIKRIESSFEDETPVPEYRRFLKGMMKQDGEQRHVKPIPMPGLTKKLHETFCNSRKDEKRTLSALTTSVHINSKYSLATIKTDPSGVLTLFNNVKGSPIMFFVSTELIQEVMGAIITKHQKQDGFHNEKFDTDVFLVPRSSTQFKVIIVKEGESIFIQPGKAYQWVSLGTNVLIEQPIVIHSSSFIYTNHVTTFVYDPLSNGINDNIVMAADESNSERNSSCQDDGEVLEKMTENDRLVFPCINQRMDESGSEKDIDTDTEDALSIVKVEPETGLKMNGEKGKTGTQKRGPMNRVLKNFIGNKTFENLLDQWEEEKRYQKKYGKWSIELNKYQKKDIYNYPHVFGIIKSLKEQGATEQVTTVYVLPKHLQNNLPHLVPSMKRKKCENGQEEDIEAAHYKHVRLFEGYLFDSGGKCAMSLDENGDEICSFLNGRQPDINRHIRSVHFGKKTTRKNLKKSKKN